MSWALAAPIEDSPNIARRKSHPSLVTEHCEARLDRHHLAADRQPAAQRVNRRSTEWNAALFRTLAPHGDRPGPEVEGVDIETTQLA